MFDRFSSQLQSAGIFLLVGILVLVFASQFGGPQAGGCSTDVKPALSVGPTNVTVGSFQAVLALGYNGTPAERLEAAEARKHAANGIVERMLLVEEAQRLGMDVSPDDAMRAVLRADEVRVTTSVDRTDNLYGDVRQGGFRGADGAIDRDRIEGFIDSLRRTDAEFAAWQADELLAERMRDVVRSRVAVAPGEVWDAFVAETEKATFRYVRFRPSYYADQLEPTVAELDAFIASHAQQVNDEFAANRTQYEDLEEQVRARHILIKVEETADDAAKAAARARIDALLGQARAADAAGFAALARQHSEDTGSGRKGGDLGWNPRGRMVPPFDEAQFALQPGQTSAVVQSQFGFHIIRVVGRRQGDVAEVDAKRDIAERLLRAERGRAEAERAAAALLARLASGTSIDDIAAELSPEPVEGQPARELAEDAPKVETASEVGAAEAPSYDWSAGSAVTAAMFGLANEGDLVAAPIRAGDDFVVARLDTRARATEEAFTAEVRTRIAATLLTSKQREAVATYTRALRARAEREGRVTIDPSTLAYPDLTGSSRSGG